MAGFGCAPALFLHLVGCALRVFLLVGLQIGLHPGNVWGTTGNRPTGCKERTRMPRRTKVVDEGEARRLLLDEGWTYPQMVDLYREKYGVETSPSMWARF